MECEWGESSLAVSTDRGNLLAGCELARTLVRTGARDEAWTIYADLATDDRTPCDAVAAMRDIEFVKTHGVLFKRVSLDDPLPQGPIR